MQDNERYYIEKVQWDKNKPLNEMHPLFIKELENSFGFAYWKMLQALKELAKIIKSSYGNKS